MANKPCGAQNIQEIISIHVIFISFPKWQRNPWKIVWSLGDLHLLGITDTNAWFATETLRRHITRYRGSDG